MKKQTKKPAKKSAAKVKPLIDGQYSHKFLTRWEPEAGEVLLGVQRLTGEKTLVGAVRRAVDAYRGHIARIQELEIDLNTVRKQMNTQANLLLSLKQNFKTLVDLPLVELAIHEDSCPECGEPERGGRYSAEEGFCQKCGFDKEEV